MYVAQQTGHPAYGRYRLHHVGIVVPSLEKAVAGYSNTFAFHEASIPFDDTVQRVRVSFVRVAGDVFLEFIEPAGPSTPVTQFLSKTGGGLHHLAFEVENIESAVRELSDDRGVVVCQPVKGFEGRRIAFLFPNMQPSLLTELVERRPPV